ncbi:ArsR/SmtB family transcription factor [Thauera linaloolentis]|uniref:ArsR family transcriptional regulator n=1 Tax=Thauera linaloolentis (strain DSM 12138 / JCM 21573 / CCUG 41526 / CIP 105981 / IAM 15112 / NBRC 102519 / 47Lol) TaxID=1123367 RepID=N6Z6I8_THAL4|nr:metalloregulator ArsR/SmtB family transcription factor [Thauera linaloolentis]ENO89968.1 ArsR family transcriptional regulator [Thauera linaloolentis 47Lol = DSM 12138]MCM8566605.1 metalloregulator ArsR/SmtB family transcription factor [Thauera linaloolentis]
MTSYIPRGGSELPPAPAEGEAFALSALSQNDITILAETFRLLGDPSRLRIMLCCMEGSTSVGEIADSLDLSQSLVSHHLRLLRGARLVKGIRRAKHIFYEVADQHVSQVLQDMASHIAEEHTDD